VTVLYTKSKIVLTNIRLTEFDNSLFSVLRLGCSWERPLSRSLIAWGLRGKKVLCYYYYYYYY
jgi:hypothetical protein